MSSYRVTRFSVNTDDSIFIEFEASKGDEVIIRSLVLSLEQIVENYYLCQVVKDFFYAWQDV